jgi:hypothetical protein
VGIKSMYNEINVQLSMQNVHFKKKQKEVPVDWVISD